jgi:hypothetical protein
MPYTVYRNCEDKIMFVSPQWKEVFGVFTARNGQWALVSTHGNLAEAMRERDYVARDLGQQATVLRKAL